DKETALILSEFLRTEHFDVSWAQSIDEAKQALASGSFAAVTLDLKLDGQNGADFFLYLRNDPKTVNLPVLVVSAYIERGKLQLSALAHAIDWLEKPIEPSLLLLKLNRLITSREADSTNSRILHVEDDEDIVTIVGLELGRHFDYTAVSSVKDARAVLGKSLFDLVILDLGLPDGMGTDLLSDIRISQGDIPIVIFSARDMSAEHKDLVSALYSKTKISTDILARNLKALLKC
ncbi:MAG TPA: response regulator, partial [Rheinheimera sp.]|nr:response regulator [Rheinheimera sp.]